MKPRVRGLRSALLLAVLALAALGAPRARAGGVDPPKPPPGPEPRFFLSWKAPFGTPGALENLSETCVDEARFDTLYLCFDPVRDTSRVVGMTATLRFWPASGDTLGPHWRLDRDPRYRGLRADLDPDSIAGVSRPWLTAGAGGVRYRSLPGGGQVRMVFAVPPSGEAEVYGGKTYAFARVMIPRPPRGDDCARPVCIEWESGSLAYGPRNEPITHAGVRFVSWKSPGATVCAAYRRFTGAKPWTPPPAPRH